MGTSQKELYLTVTVNLVLVHLCMPLDQYMQFLQTLSHHLGLILCLLETATQGKTRVMIRQGRRLPEL